MFQGLLKRAERSLDQMIARVLERALVAVPLLVAAGFATAALTVKLVEQYGAVSAYGVMAALFAVIGLVTMAIVGVGNGAAEPDAAEAPSASASSDQSEQAGEPADVADLLTPELRSMLASMAPAALPSVVRGVGRNLPLILILAIVAFVISRFAETESAEATAPESDETEVAAAADTRAAAA